MLAEGTLIGVMRCRGDNVLRDVKLLTEFVDLSLFNDVNDPCERFLLKYSLKLENSGGTCVTGFPVSGDVLKDGVAELAVEMVLAVLNT